MTPIKFLWHHAKKIKLLFFMTLTIFVAGFLFTRLATLFSAEIVGFFAENSNKNFNHDKLILLISALFVCTLLYSFTLFLTHWFEARFLPIYNSNVINDLFLQAHRHSHSFFAEEMSGKISGKIQIISNNVQAAFSLIMDSTRTLFGLLVTFSFILFINWKLGLFYVLVTIFFSYLTWLERIKISKAAEDSANYESIAGGVLVDSLSNADNVKAFANLKHEQHTFYKAFKKYLKSSQKLALSRAKINYKNNWYRDAMLIIFYSGVFYTWYASDLSIANVVFITASIASITEASKSLGYSMVHIFTVLGKLKESLSFLYQSHEIVDIPNAGKLKIKKPEIAINQITYHYKNQKPLFSNFNLYIKAGEKIGLVGRSGSGKSTLIKLISRNYNLTKGEILIDGQNISQITLDSLHRQISLIPQDPCLFNRTIMENIRYGNIKASNQKVIAAAQKAYCHDFIMELPNGYESKVGEKGIMLSGGERQRIAIARAILQDAPILILDEATSALDSESEALIQKALSQLMTGKTVIAIAHRLSTLKEMNSIVVLNKGKIIEEGTQTNLLKAKGEFYKFYKIQSESFLSSQK